MRADRDLVQIVDAAMAEAVRKSGSWVACKPGCRECCLGPFPITMLDVARLRSGLAELQNTNPTRADAVRRRAIDQVARLTYFPGEPQTGILDEGADSDERFDRLPDEDPCPALDPDTGTCDLYAFRPITCRMFGPAVLSGDALAVCELCYHGATEQEIAACAVEIEPDKLESEILTGDTGKTIVAFALAR